MKTFPLFSYFILSSFSGALLRSHLCHGVGTHVSVFPQDGGHAMVTERWPGHRHCRDFILHRALVAEHIPPVFAWHHGTPQSGPRWPGLGGAATSWPPGAQTPLATSSALLHLQSLWPGGRGLRETGFWGKSWIGCVCLDLFTDQLPHAVLSCRGGSGTSRPAVSCCGDGCPHAQAGIGRDRRRRVRLAEWQRLGAGN